MLSSLREMDLVKELTLPMLGISLYASLGGASFGIDFNYWAGLLGMAQFQKDFGVWDPATESWIIPSSWQSIATGTPQAGLAVGCLLSGFFGNKFGRVRSFWIAGVIAIVGILIQAASIHSYWQLMVGRIVNSISMGIICNVVPAYQSECAPAKIRGTLVNTYQFFLLVGAVMAATCNWGLESRTDQWAYRVILILQFIIPVVMIIGGFILPESPRWLISKGRDEEALKVLKFLRKGSSDLIVEEEVRLLVAAEEEQKEHQKTSSWIHCFQGTNLRRTAIATGVQCLQNAQGNSFIASYSVVFLQAIGQTNVYQVTVLLYFTNMAASIFAFYFADKIGRRVLLFGAACVMAVCMFSVAAVTGYHNTSSGQQGALAALFIWQFAQAIGWASCVWIVTAEVPTTRLRERTITIATFGGFCVGVLVTYINPFMQDAGYGNLQGKVGFVYGSFSVISAIWVIFMIPELKGRSLEELDELFEKKVSVWRFGSYQTEGLGAQVRQLEGIGKDVDLASKYIHGLELEDERIEERSERKGDADVKSVQV